MLIKFALRNVLRNRRRSLLTALAIFFAAMIVGLAQGWINGMLDLFMNNYIIYQTGHARITTKDYQERERFIPVDSLLFDDEQIKTKVLQLEGVEQVEERIRFGILLGHQETTVNALGVGVDLDKTVLTIKDKLIAGTFTGEGIYIGKDLAKRLNVQLGDELLLATKTSEGGLNGIKLPIQGIVNFGITMYDKRMFFISLEAAKRLLKIYRGTIELYVFAKQDKLTDIITDQISRLLPDEGSVMSYKQQLGSLYTTMMSMKVIYVFVEALILFLASFIVINTMMMAIFERLHEIGTLKAIGMSDRDLFINFTLEGAFIGAVGGIPGALVGYGLIALLSVTGVNLESSLSSLDMPIEYMLYPSLSLIALLSAVILSILVPALAAMIPARYARRLSPAEALRK